MCIIDITMATEVMWADLTEHHGLADGDDPVEIAQSLKLCLFISTYNVELSKGRGRIRLSRPYISVYLSGNVTYLFNVVQRLFVALEPHNDGVRDHHGGKLHHLLIVGGGEQHHLTGLGQEPAVQPDSVPATVHVRVDLPLYADGLVLLALLVYHDICLI